MTTITISRQDGSLGNEIAAKLSQRLNMQLILRQNVIQEWMKPEVSSYELHMLLESPKFFLEGFKDGASYKEYIENRLKETAKNTPSIIVGMGGNIIFSDDMDTIRVRITASDEIRISRIQNKYGLEEREARSLLDKSDKKHRKYITTLYGSDWADTLNYDVTLNTDKLTLEECVEIIAFQAEIKNSMKYFSMHDSSIVKTKTEPRQADFKHPAEEEFANILDMYGIDWEYEPRTFPIEWDAEGNVTMAFSPDFYLVKFDTYIEITTMEQKYVTTKNKKVRKLRELYPGINVNIVYKKDFHSLLKRFGFSGGAEIDEFNRS